MIVTTGLFSTTKSLTPINLEFDEVVRLLHLGETVKVILEPGDATRYEFFLIPMGNPEFRVSGTGAGHFILVWPSKNYTTTIQLHERAAPLAGHLGEWTSVMFTEWFGHLSRAIESFYTTARKYRLADHPEENCVDSDCPWHPTREDEHEGA